MAKNKNLHKARGAKQNEHYTQLEDIAAELKHYKSHFKGKTVYCNCDDPRVSNFFHYFSYKFKALGLKKLISTCYKSQYPEFYSRNDSEQAIKLEYDGPTNGNRVPTAEEIGIYPLKGNGDFRSRECIELLKQADIVCTNPPFSLFKEYVSQLVEYDKKFLIIGNMNAVTYKDIFIPIKENKIWLGYGRGDMEFQVPDHYPPKKHRYRMDENGKKFYSLGNAKWFTNLDIKKRYYNLILTEKYSPEKYPKYDNYDAIEVGKTEDIPKDYTGVMGVPITFLDKHNPDQFEIIGVSEQCGRGLSNGLWYSNNNIADPTIKGKKIYVRFFIRNRKPTSS